MKLKINIYEQKYENLYIFLKYFIITFYIIKNKF